MVMGRVSTYSPAKGADGNPNEFSNDLLFESAFECSATGKALVAPNGRWLRVNRSLSAIVGYTPEELYQLDFQTITHPDDLETDLEYVRQLLADELDAYRMEKRYLHKNGRVVWILLSVTLVRRADGSPHFFISEIQDITAQKEAEEERRASDARLRAILDSSWDGIGVALGDRIVYCNPAMTRLFGFESADELSGIAFADLIAPSDRALVVDTNHRRMIGEPVSRMYETRARRRDGTEFWIEGCVSTFEQDGDLYTMAVLRDISQRRALQDALKQSAIEANEKSAEIRLARDQALAATRAKSAFLATMSHEIRTPMNGVLGMLALLQGTSLDSEQQEYATVARASGEALLALLSDILDLSTAEAGRIEIERTECDVRVVLADVLFAQRDAARGKAIALITDVAANVPEAVLGDPPRLRQVLTNLVGNAVKFTNSGGAIRVRVACATLERGGEVLRLTISDTGVGISAEAKEHLFQPFSQLDSSTTRRYGGTGLGLAISRQLVELMGGTIAVDSALGTGSTFTVELPLVRAVPISSAAGRGAAIDAAADPGAISRIPAAVAAAPAGMPQRSLPAAMAPPPAAASGTAERGGGLRLLVVDDNTINQKVVSKLLEKRGHQVDIAVNGVDAVAATERIRYDLVLMDCRMPEMDGYEATAAIRRREAGVSEAGAAPDAELAAGDREHLPIVALTASSMRGDRELCLAAGMDDYLTKPVQPAALDAVLQHWQRVRSAAA
jgi:PAS domain S-box-containing protein